MCVKVLEEYIEFFFISVIADKKESKGSTVRGKVASHFILFVLFKCFTVCTTINAINLKLYFIATDDISATKK